jgi:hypothetical protein
LGSSPLNGDKRKTTASGRRSSEFEEQIGPLSVEDGRKLFYTGSPPGNFKVSINLVSSSSLVCDVVNRRCVHPQDDDIRLPDEPTRLRTIPAIQPVTAATAGRCGSFTGYLTVCCLHLNVVCAVCQVE